LTYINSEGDKILKFGCYGIGNVGPVSISLSWENIIIRWNMTTVKPEQIFRPVRWFSLHPQTEDCCNFKTILILSYNFMADVLSIL